MTSKPDLHSAPAPQADITLAQLLINVFSVLFIICTFLYLENEQFQQEQQDAQERDAARQRQVAQAREAMHRKANRQRSERPFDRTNALGHGAANDRLSLREP
ncbi:MAG TPA: hypothetical protein VIF60_06795 [Burkholderiaceae bacterium]|jgi:hypothetical protein